MMHTVIATRLRAPASIKALMAVSMDLAIISMGHLTKKLINS